MRVTGGTTKAVTADPAYKKDVEKLGMVPVYKSPEEATKNFAAMQAESEKTRERDAVLAGLGSGSGLLGTADSLAVMQNLAKVCCAMASCSFVGSAP